MTFTEVTIVNLTKFIQRRESMNFLDAQDFACEVLDFLTENGELE